ncbi:hypothetical protein MJG53_016020 [Ovis ammon polii x Ovis aries]|uniref:Uncharacterized protein n=1 Tax=Ovis ammon polii x Ovis aries TaxID=2918886 RepID=A0ACB9UCL0_9CETA|nr:hypothetical protein MJG53_016020 [Ovis ammon polii x Ovis aries]
MEVLAASEPSQRKPAPGSPAAFGPRGGDSSTSGHFARTGPRLFVPKAIRPPPPAPTPVPHSLRPTGTISLGLSRTSKRHCLIPSTRFAFSTVCGRGVDQVVERQEQLRCGDRLHTLLSGSRCSSAVFVYHFNKSDEWSSRCLVGRPLVELGFGRTFKFLSFSWGVDDGLLKLRVLAGEQISFWAIVWSFLKPEGAFLLGRVGCEREYQTLKKAEKDDDSVDRRAGELICAMLQIPPAALRGWNSCSGSIDAHREVGVQELSSERRDGFNDLGSFFCGVGGCQVGMALPVSSGSHVPVFSVCGHSAEVQWLQASITKPGFRVLALGSVHAALAYGTEGKNSLWKGGCLDTRGSFLAQVADTAIYTTSTMSPSVRLRTSRVTVSAEGSSAAPSCLFSVSVQAAELLACEQGRQGLTRDPGAVEQALQDKFPARGWSFGVSRNAAKLWARSEAPESLRTPIWEGCVSAPRSSAYRFPCEWSTSPSAATGMFAG